MLIDRTDNHNSRSNCESERHRRACSYISDRFYSHLTHSNSYE